jgi:YD repeat-containing protein
VLADRTGFAPCLEGPTLGRVARSFTASGRLAGWTEPNGDTSTRLYHASGRVQEEIDALGNSARRDAPPRGIEPRTNAEIPARPASTRQA